MYVVHVSAEWHITKIITKLTRFLHFSGILALSEYEVPAKLFKMCPLIWQLHQRFQRLQLLNQNIVMYDSLTPWKGELSLKHMYPWKLPYLA